MKKNIVSIALALFLVAGIGNVVYAHNGSVNDWSFDEILSYMKQMHEMNEQDLGQMYQNCHGFGCDNETVPANNKL